jgi:hypothetical protein
VKPAFSATRREAVLPGATRSSMRWKPCSSTSATVSASTASGAMPNPRLSAQTAYEISVTRPTQSVRFVHRQPTSRWSSRRTMP